MEERIEILAEQSHRGWMGEKQRQGYADHPFVVACCQGCAGTHCGLSFEEHGGLRQCELPRGQHHDDMLPYADLPEHIKDYDRVTVRGVLEGIKQAGYTIVKADENRVSE